MSKVSEIRGAPLGPFARLSASLNPGVRKREFFAWAMFDFANSAYTTVVITAVFNAYFVATIANKATWATLLWTLALAASYLLIMLTAPALGEFADRHANKKRLLALSTLGCVVATAAMGWLGPGDLALACVLIILSNVCYGTGENLAAAFLPELARADAMGRISGFSWAVGYVGGLAALALALVWIDQASARGVPVVQSVPATLWITAGFFALSAIPTFLMLRERAGEVSSRTANTSSVDRMDLPATTPPSEGRSAGPFAYGASETNIASNVAHPIGSGRAKAVSEPLPQSRTRATWLARSGLPGTLASLRKLRAFPDLKRFLYCIVAYQAGIQIVITITAIYAQEAMGFSTEQTLKLVLIVNVAAAVGAFVFGPLQDRFGHRRSLQWILWSWLATIVLVALTSSVSVFWFAAHLAGLCLGSAQSAGRALVGYLSPERHLGEFFGLWGLAVKFSAILGPVCYGLVAWLTAGQHRLAMLVCGVFFIVGLVLISRVNVLRGREAALASEEAINQGVVRRD